MSLETIKLHGRDVKPHKATQKADFGARTVLTNSPWEYVSLWLQRSDIPSAKDAAFYWTQARAFTSAAQGLPQESAPLPLYYSYMNATKALLVSKGIALQEFHGITRHKYSESAEAIGLDNEGVSIQKKGIFPILSKYLKEQESQKIHSLKDLLFNLPCIHRTYCITYRQQSELFIPLTDCRYTFDQSTGSAYLVAEISADFDYKAYVDRLPSGLQIDPRGNNPRCVRSIEVAKISSSILSTDEEIRAIGDLNSLLRPNLQYISGSTTLWYAKARPGTNEKSLQRSPLTISLAAMHRLSELSRYSPMQLAYLFKGDQNWLLSEFIRMSPQQFADEIAAEITGHQCMTPNVRPAS
jgi:YaaC-like Protein